MVKPIWGVNLLMDGASLPSSTHYVACRIIKPEDCYLAAAIDLSQFWNPAVRAHAGDSCICEWKNKKQDTAVEFCHCKRPKVEDTHCGYNSPPLRVDRRSGCHLFPKAVNQLCALGEKELTCESESIQPRLAEIYSPSRLICFWTAAALCSFSL